MAYDFSKVPPEQIEYNRGLLKAMKANSDESDTIIQYQGGYIPLGAYEGWQAGGQRGELITMATKVGAELALYVELWLNVNAGAAIEVYGRESDEFQGILKQLRFMGNTACQALASPQAGETYIKWKAANLNTPADMTDEELRLGYTAELLRFAMEMYEIQQEIVSGKRTLH